MGLAFILLTQIVVRNIIDYRFVADRTNEINNLSTFFSTYYKEHNNSWEKINEVPLNYETLNLDSEASVMLKSTNKQTLYSNGVADYITIEKLGIKSSVHIGGKPVAFLYYYDSDVANVSIVRHGVSSSVTIILFIGALIFTIVSLLVAYLLSKKLTHPLTLLTSAINRLGEGEFGIQASINTGDEYETLAKTFNHMSSQLKQAEELRRNLVADVAHELRTPITIIRGKLDLIQQGGVSIKPESLLPLQDELIRLTRLVDDLHQLSLAEAKKLTLELKEINVASILKRIIDHVTPDAEEKNIHIILNDFSKTSTLYADSNRITQVFLNLIVNALRYTPEGGSVNVNIDEETAAIGEQHLLRISISDTGIGIEEEHLPFVFNRFYRTDRARNRNSGGTGIGLAIAKEFVLAHKGTIEVQSSVGYGTTFTVLLPFINYAAENS